MPEIAELEALCRYTRKRLLSKKIVKAQASTSALMKGCTCVDIAEGITGQTITDVRRYGKLLVFDFSNDAHVVMHFALKGELDIGMEQPSHVGVTLYFTDGSYMHYTDLSCMGHVRYINGEKFDDIHEIAGIYALGPDSLSDSISMKYLEYEFGKRTASIKSVLMDQHVIAGIGNAYACEILYHAGILPQRSARSLSQGEIHYLLASITYVLDDAVDKCISACEKDYHLSVFEPLARKNLKVFTHAGLKCSACGTEISLAKLNGRNTYYCTGCQK